MKKISFTLCALTLSLTLIEGANITWQGPGTNLTTNTNWSGNVTPGTNDTAIFDGSVSSVPTNPVLASGDTFDVNLMSFINPPPGNSWLFSFDNATLNLGSGPAGTRGISNSNPLINVEIDLTNATMVSFFNTATISDTRKLSSSPVDTAAGFGSTAIKASSFTHALPTSPATSPWAA